MAEGEWGVHTEEVGMAKTTMAGSTFENAEMSASSGVCDGVVARMLGKLNTRPGPDEEVVIQIIAHRRPVRDARQIRDVRRQG